MKKVNIMNQNTVSRAYVYLMLTFFLFFTGFEGYRNIFDSKCVVFTAVSIVYIVISFIFGILGIWLSKKIDFVDTPKISKRKSNEK